MNIVGIVIGVLFLTYSAWSLSSGKTYYRITLRRQMRVHTRGENPLAYWGLFFIYTVLGFVILITSVVR
ncbi:MAG: hypothetical protein JW934_23775 [Anaerolineae bacterium]|nr:hypothetical protein [Anaerolineae bacterium]